ncbi:hypothetical protein KI387_039020, partial [Taxus chinensis]
MSNVWMLVRRFTTARPTAWRNVSIIKNRYAHKSSEGDNDRVSQVTKSKEHLKK